MGLDVWCWCWGRSRGAEAQAEAQLWSLTQAWRVLLPSVLADKLTCKQSQYRFGRDLQFKL